MMTGETIPARRFFLLVLDGCGVGALPDATDFGEADVLASTLTHVSEAVNGLSLPYLQPLGIGNITPLIGCPPAPHAPALWGRLAEQSRAKDSVAGHWEMMGLITQVPLPTYPKGFPSEVVKAFAQIVGRSVLGNRPASGTEIIRELGEEHCRTGSPILYTSADSVFQVAAHENPEIFGLQRLLAVCEAARAMLVPPHHVGRVIARPFVGESQDTFQRTENRRDYPLTPPAETVLDHLTAHGKQVHAIGKIAEFFSGRGITSVEVTRNNPEHCAALTATVQSKGVGEKADFVFANLEDFDMLYGHRNDPVNFARLLQEFDTWLGTAFLPYLRPGDLVGITADHGNDPTTPSTDHSREFAPLLVFGPAVTQPRSLGDRTTFADWGATVCRWLGVPTPPHGEAFPLPECMEKP